MIKSFVFYQITSVDSEGLARAIVRGGVYIISACGGWSRGGGGIILGGILRVEAIRTTEIEEWRVPGRVEESEVRREQ